MPVQIAIAISLVLHLAAIVIPDAFDASSAAERIKPGAKTVATVEPQTLPFQVSLSAATTPERPKASTGSTVRKHIPPRHSNQHSTAPPRFLTAPNWAGLERIVRHTRFEATIRIQVAANGLASSVSVIESTPFGESILEEIRLELYRARYVPAMRNSRPMAGHFDIIIGAQDRGANDATTR